MTARFVVLFYLEGEAKAESSEVVFFYKAVNNKKVCHLSEFPKCAHRMERWSDRRNHLGNHLCSIFQK